MDLIKAFGRGLLLVILSVCVPTFASVLTTGWTSTRDAKPVFIPASTTIDPPRATSTPGNASGGRLVSYHAAQLQQAPLTHI